MLPVSPAPPTPAPPALRPAGEIKVRKRRENRSSASSVGGAQISTWPEAEPATLSFDQRCSSPLKKSVQGSPPSIVEPESPAALRRKSSKSRVLSRVLGSIQASRSNPTLQPTRSGQSDGGIFRKLSMRRRPSFPPAARSMSSGFPAEPAVPTILTSPSSRSNFRPGRLVANPSSCGPLQPPSTQMADQTSPRSRSATRGPPPILSADLNVVTECDALSLNRERSVWVAVEARGVVKPDVSPLGQGGKGAAGLDVVVILDNSRFASPESLETACDVALRIAQMSAETDDRLAVFCACCRHCPAEAKTSACLLHPLQLVDTAALDRELGNVRARIARPPAADTDMHETLQEAVKALAESTADSPEPVRLDRCIVFVLSPRYLDDREVTVHFPTVTVNVVCTAAVPYHSGLPARSSPRFMLPNSTFRNVFSSNFSLKESDCLLTQAADVISHAREGRVFGSITDLCIDIRPSKGCVVESIVGDMSTAKLDVGQTVSVLIRVKVPSVSTRERCAHNALNELDEAFEQLENLLGETNTEVLTASACYKQSCFPERNLVVVEQACTIRRPNPLSAWSVGLPTDPAVTSRAELELYRRFVFLIATQDPPHIAINALDTFCENTTKYKHCSPPWIDYARQVRQELVHQSKVMQPFMDPESDNFSPSDPAPLHTHSAGLQSPEKYSSSETGRRASHKHRQVPSSPHFSFDARDSLRFTATQFPVPQRAQRSLPATPLTGPRSDVPSASPRFADTLRTEATATPRIGKRTSTSDDAESSSVDEARAIWRHMRRNVSIRATSPGCGTPSWPMGYRSLGRRTEIAREYRERELKKKALANKRSIGADTLRSLAMSSEVSVTETGSAPWLL